MTGIDKEEKVYTEHGSVLATWAGFADKSRLYRGQDNRLYESRQAWEYYKRHEGEGGPIPDGSTAPVSTTDRLIDSLNAEIAKTQRIIDEYEALIRSVRDRQMNLVYLKNSIALGGGNFAIGMLDELFELGLVRVK